MVVPISCVVLDADAANRQEMSTVLSHSGVSVVAALPHPDQLPSVLEGSDAPQLAVINLDPDPTDTLKRVAPFVQRYPSVNFFAMSQVVDTNLLMDVIHAGFKEFIPLPIPQEKFLAGIERIASAEKGVRRAKLINVIPTVGGCGATTVSCNMAVAFAQAGKTVLVDLDLIQGAVASSFDLHPQYTLADVMDLANKLDRQLLDNALAVHAPSKLSILGRPERPEDARRINHAGFSRLMGLLGRHFDYVVTDSQMCLEPIYTTAMQAADVNIIVMQLNIPSARNAERFINSLRRSGIDEKKIMVVVNRFVKKGWDIEPGEVERTLGLKIAWTIPNDFRNAIEAINYGQPVLLRAPRAEISSSLCGLVGSLSSNGDGKTRRN